MARPGVLVFPPVRRRRRWAGLVVVAVLAAAGPWATPEPSPRGRTGHLVGPGGGNAGAAGVPGGAVPGGPSGKTAGWVQAENGRPGTTDWTISGPQHDGDLEGFADSVSAQAGDTVRLYVSSKAPSFHVEAYRMGWYGGAGGRLVLRSPEVSGEVQPAPEVLARTHTVETQWVPSLTLHVDRSWPPGDYLLKLVGNGGQQHFVPLTVRDDASAAAYVVVNAVTTWQAYNLWGGYDLYEGRSGRGSDFSHRSRIVSFDRPYGFGQGAADFLGNELPLVQLAESRGLDVTYTTDADLDRAPELALRHRALLSLGHDEYWSTAMRQGVEQARDQGVNLAFLGANAIFRHIRFEDSPLGPRRHEVDYKQASEDPLRHVDDAEVTVDWRSPPIPRPESAVIGDLYECNPVKADMVVAAGSSWVFEGTGVKDGTHLHNTVGPEYDRYDPRLPGPRNVEVLAHSPVRCRGQASFSDMTYYSAASGAGVFATGTNWWISKLALQCEIFVDPCVTDVVTRVTMNVLTAFGTGPAGRIYPSVATRFPLSISGAVTDQAAALPEKPVRSSTTLRTPVIRRVPSSTSSSSTTSTSTSTPRTTTSHPQTTTTTAKKTTTTTSRTTPTTR